MAITIDLSGKNALVTGGTRGIGLHVSTILADAGARVGMIYRADSSAAESAVNSLGEGRHFAVQGDLRDADSITGATKQALSRFENKLDIVVLSAADQSTFGPLASSDIGAWDTMFKANVIGNVALLKSIASSIQPGGSVVFISSGAGFDPIEGLSAYGASKAAMNQLCAVLAQEWGPNGIRVNVVSPGSTSHSAPDYDNLTENQKSTIAQTALRRIGTATDVAKTVLFFASDLSSFITGQWVRVNGGRV